MSRLRSFRRQILCVVPVLAHGERHALGHAHAALLHHRDLAGIVRQQANGGKAHGFQNVRAKTEITLVVFEAKTMVRLDGIETLILKRVGPHLIGQPDTAAFLIEVQ